MSDNNKIIKDASALGQFHSAISQICDEKGLDKNSVITTIESALAAAYKKDYGKKGQIIISHMEAETGSAKFKQLKEVVDETMRNMGDLEKIEIDKDEFLEKSKISEEKIESRSLQGSEEENDYLPKFNNDKDVLLKDAQKVNKNIKLDVIVFDENHFTGTTSLSNKIFNSYVSKRTVKLYLTATDLDLAITSTAPVKSGENGKTTVPAQLFYDIIRKVPDGSEISIETEGNNSLATINE